MKSAVPTANTTGPRLRIYARFITVGVGLIDETGRETVWHFGPRQDDGPLGELTDFLAQCISFPTLGAIKLAGEVCREKPHEAQQDYRWTLDYAITPQGLQAAQQLREQKWKQEPDYGFLVGYNCVDFVREIAGAAGVDLPKPRVKTPGALIQKIRGRLRHGRAPQRPFAARIPASVFRGPLPASALAAV